MKNKGECDWDVIPVLGFFLMILFGIIGVIWLTDRDSQRQFELEKAKLTTQPAMVHVEK
jgi:hypothetical protein